MQRKRKKKLPWVPPFPHCFPFPILLSLTALSACVTFLTNVEFFILFLLICVWARGQVWRSEDNFRELFLSFSHRRAGYWTQAVRLGSRCLTDRATPPAPLTGCVASKLLSSLLLWPKSQVEVVSTSPVFQTVPCRRFPLRPLVFMLCPVLECSSSYSALYNTCSSFTIHPKGYLPHKSIPDFAAWLKKKERERENLLSLHWMTTCYPVIMP